MTVSGRTEPEVDMGSQPPLEPADPPGVVIARLRRRARLTGQQLGHMVGMSQAKVSRIETGQTSVSPTDVARIAHALGVADDEADRLVVQAQQLQNRMTDWRQATGAVGGIQTDIARIETKTAEFRVFQPSVIVGLCQTSEYARAVLTSLDAVYGTPTDQPRAGAIAAALSERMRRQIALADAGRQFRFLMSESALAGRIAEPVHMLAQMAHLRKLSRQPNIHMRIIPSDAPLPFPLVNGFELLDDECVFVDVFNTSMASRGRDDVVAYRRVFDELEQVATEHVDPFLDRYRDLYRALDS
jgi:transcriptional regulator with XRE-family HTH domain